MRSKKTFENGNPHYDRLEHHHRMMDQIAMRSYNAVQKRKASLQMSLLEHMRQLKQIGTSPFYDILLHEYRDPDSFRYRWVIDVQVKPKPIKGKNGNADHSIAPSLFRINIAENTIMFERSDTQTKRIFRYKEKIATEKRDVHPLNNTLPGTDNSISKQRLRMERQQSAMEQITKLLQQEFGEWVTHSCPDHAAMLFLLPCSSKIKPNFETLKPKQTDKNPKAPRFKYS